MPTSIDLLKEKGRRLRIHSLRSTTAAGSGHPSSCLSAADLVSVVFFREMRYDPRDPHNPENDRFVLSKGHAAPLLYAAYAEAGIIEESRLITLRRLDSDLEGHPTPRLPWVDVATGSLGQGLSAGLGMALAARVNKLTYDTYVLLGDGECAEGAVWEAAAVASYYEVPNLYAIVDVNGLGQSQHTMHRFDVETFAAKFRAFGWYAVTIDGHNYSEIIDAFAKCRREGGSRPRVIVARTVKGKGVSFLENMEGWHGKPVPKQELDKALAELSEPYASDGFVPNPRPRPQWEERPVNIDISIGRKIGESVATREAYGDALVKLAEKNDRIVALDGDTKNSTFSEKLLKARPDRFFEMFIAEQNMVGVAAGLSARGMIPFVSTFAVFLTRAFDQIRMAAVSRANIKFCGSHVGVSIGEDGPSQMGLEDLAMFRAVPGSVVLYPCDGVSAERLVAEAARIRGICYIRMSRPKTPVLYANDEQFPVGGSKILRRSEQDRATVIGAGITVHEALKAAETLASEGIRIRVIDAYSVKPVDRATILASAKQSGANLIVVEDHYEEGGLGDAVLNAVGNAARVIKLAVREIPRSGPPEALLDTYGISSKHIVQAVKSLL
ncbi:MAG TPA: transketolase [Candidatus Binatia bacterium]|nr:transketolase [Candidatus Binatia bacterium]